MKTLRLILLFIAITGVVIGMFFLRNNSDPGETIVIADNTFDYYRKTIEESWKEKGDWSKTLFENNRTMLRQISVKNPSINTNTLYDLNTSLAIEIIDDKIFTEWHSPSCSKQMVDKYRKAVRTIKKHDSNALNNTRLKAIESVYSTYISVDSFVTENIGLQPIFYGESWNSYQQYAREITERKETILKNNNYREHLSNIRLFKDSLCKIDNKIKQGRVMFYDSLQTLIINYYSPIPATERSREQLSKLRALRHDFQQECDSYERLNTFLEQFNNDVETNTLNHNGYIY